MTIDQILEAAETHGASDVFLQEGELPRLKIRDQISLLGEEPVEMGALAGLWQVCGADVMEDLDRDSGMISASGTRYRANLHKAMGRLGAVLRRIRTEIPSLAELGLPAALLERWARRKHGLVLVTGPTGSGKSTTVAAMLGWMNQHTNRHIVTIEDPVEFLFSTSRCHFTQREVGRDTESFAHGLRSAVRQAPDVIFVGEIRDYETALTALQACETGHLVLATLHSETVPDTMVRFVNLFPSDQLPIGLHLLSTQLVGVVCQKLVTSVDGEPLVLVEHLENGGATRNWIARQEHDQLSDYLARGTDPNAVSFMKSIVAASKAGRIDEATAVEASGSEAEFRRAARGISG
jgi:twitching motility protein PilT